MAAPPVECYQFGRYTISPREVFYTTDLSFCFVNARPVVPGHFIVCPRRQVKRFADLTDAEVTDLWITARNVSAKLEQYLKATSLTISLQDGLQAGQSVTQVHIHVIPRKLGDFERNDDIYDLIDKKEKELNKKLDLDEDKKDQPQTEMANEADAYRVLFF